MVEPLVSELPVSMLTLASGQIELHRVNLEFAGPPSEAVDYLVRTLRHASAAVFGATLHATKDRAVAMVGDLGVAISTRGSAHAGRGGVAISLLGDMTACAAQTASRSARPGKASRSRASVARTTPATGASLAAAAMASPWREWRAATATHVVVAEDAEVLDGPAPMFAAGEGSRVHARGTTFRAGIGLGEG